MHINVERLAQGRRRVLEARGNANHGQSHGERVARVGSVERDVDICAFVDDAVDGFQVVCF